MSIYHIAITSSNVVVHCQCVVLDDLTPHVHIIPHMLYKYEQTTGKEINNVET